MYFELLALDLTDGACLNQACCCTPKLTSSSWLGRSGCVSSALHLISNEDDAGINLGGDVVDSA